MGQIPSQPPQQARSRDITVVAGLIVRDSKILVCQRRHNDSHGLLWEFPGGKVEIGETTSAALVRELREELDVDAIIGKELFRTQHRYRNSASELNLVFFEARIDQAAKLRNLVFERFEWAYIDTLQQYNFLEADKELIQLLTTGSIRLDS